MGRNNPYEPSRLYREILGSEYSITTEVYIGFKEYSILEIGNLDMHRLWLGSVATPSRLRAARLSPPATADINV